MQSQVIVTPRTYLVTLLCCLGELVGMGLIVKGEHSLDSEGELGLMHR